jgi:putative endonuclease
MKPQFTVYILRTNKNTLYTGYTKDLEKRLKVHKTSSGAKYLRKFKSFELVYSETYASKSEALKREAQIKSLSRKKKEKLIEF